MLAQRAFSSANSGTRVGFIGLGCMGNHMSRNLVANGYNVKGYDLSAEARAAAAKNGVTPVNSVAELSKDVDFIVTCLPETRHIKEVLTMEGGVFASANPGTWVCDTSTIEPAGAQEFNALAKESGHTYLDTPMSGGVTGARDGTLTFMVGGTEAEFENSKKVLDGMGKNFFHCGGPGTGEIAKIANNLILGISMVGACEGMAIGEKLGIDPKVLQKILSVSTARNWCIDTYNPRPGVLENVPAGNDYAGGFAVSLIKKDMLLAKKAAETVGADTTMIETSHEYYKHLEENNLGKKDFGYVFQYIMNNKKI